MGLRSILAVLGVAWLLAGCATSGRNFDPGQLSRLTPGESTLEEASYALGAAPAMLYGQSDGGTLALWSFKATFVTDGLYSRKQAMLQFGPDGRLVRLVDTTNVLLEPWERRKLLGPAPARLDGPAGAPWVPVPQAPAQ
ncbi:hypothetical protein [Bordetella petrii]|uniref:hypothetical protein n=1 Tax=Bordetella petrii TaxID=94624 RepID=UPI001A957D44|nr:hypothetical protein [Bordetella petrii]MBO1111679.1 hypothetical protein [Bordetella petrii]